MIEPRTNARQDDLDATVTAPTAFRRVADGRASIGPSPGLEYSRRHSARGELSHHLRRARGGQLPVAREPSGELGADRHVVGVTFDDDSLLRCGRQNPGDLVDDRPSIRTE